MLIHDDAAMIDIQVYAQEPKPNNEVRHGFMTNES